MDPKHHNELTQKRQNHIYNDPIVINHQLRFYLVKLWFHDKMLILGQLLINDMLVIWHERMVSTSHHMPH